MTEPTIVCPSCKTEIKLTESLAAPLIESTRRQYEQQIAQKDLDIRKREAAVKEQQAALAKAQESIDDQVAAKLQTERASIAAEEAKKAKLALSTDLDQKARELADLQEVIKQKDAKLTEAQKAQAELIRKQRELDDAKREMNLTIEKRVQESLSTAREQTKKEVEESIKRQVTERDQTIARMSKQLATKDEEITRRESTLKEQEAALAKARDSIDEQVATKLKDERAVIAAEEAKKAKLALSTDLDQKARELADLQVVIRQKDAKLTEAQKAQAELIRKQRELDDAKREMELTIEKRVQESLGATREQAKKEAEDSLKLKVAEKEQTIASMQRQIEELKRRAEQGSQQLQGEVQELELEAMLREKFPHDLIVPVAKGEHGGDAVQRVIGPMGQPCGAILWESKRTKNWTEGWLAKLREDQRAAKAELAVIVSQALPKDVEAFDHVDGVWVTSHRCAMPVAVALRQSLIELAAARKAGEGQQTKMELVYQYLTGPRFRHRVQAIVEKFSDMHEDLEKERKTMTRLWAKREEQIRGVIESTAGMYGDLQGIAGKTLQEIEGLDVPLLGIDDSPSNSDKR